ncbi:MAG: hypothetical protein ACLSFT_05075 [Ruminococcus callidus]
MNEVGVTVDGLNIGQTMQYYIDGEGTGDCFAGRGGRYHRQFCLNRCFGRQHR